MTATAGSMLQYRGLMSAARHPGCIATFALGGVLSRFQIQGLDTSTLTRLYQRYFYDISRLPDAGTVCRALSPAEFEDLLELLHEHRCNDSEETEWLARAMASACAGQNQFWGGMGAPH